MKIFIVRKCEETFGGQCMLIYNIIVQIHSVHFFNVVDHSPELKFTSIYDVRIVDTIAMNETLRPHHGR